MDKLVESSLSKGEVLSVRIRVRVPCLEDDAGALVRRLALKTRFSGMGWGSTPPSSAKLFGNSVMVTQQTLTLSF